MSLDNLRCELIDAHLNIIRIKIYEWEQSNFNVALSMLDKHITENVISVHVYDSFKQIDCLLINALQL